MSLLKHNRNCYVTYYKFMLNRWINHEKSYEETREGQKKGRKVLQQAYGEAVGL